MDQEKLQQGVQFLAEQGLNLCAILACPALPDEVAQALEAQEIPVQDYKSLVLLGHGGRQLWRALLAFGMKTDDPVDHFSLVMTQRFIDEYLDAPPVLMLYPTDYQIPLQKLGAVAGWHHPSPLGLGISETYGLWFAYRTAFLTTLSLPPLRNEMTVSPCDTCRDKPCISACPARAVQGIGQLKVTNCLDYRLQDVSDCQDRCMSRLACPVASEHRYCFEQINYYYTHSLATIRDYSSRRSGA